MFPGKSVREVQGLLTSREFAEWLVMMELEPQLFGGEPREKRGGPEELEALFRSMAGA